MRVMNCVCSIEKPRQNFLRKNEAASVLVLTAFFLLALFALIATAIDITLSSASLEQARHNAKLAALAALEVYYTTDGTAQDRYDAALARTNEVAKLNLIVGGKSESLRSIVASGSSDPDAPQLVAGRWYYDLGDGAKPCQVGEELPCFVPGEPSEVANSFRIEGNLYDSIPARFARTIGFNEISQVYVKATSTTVPRHGCFVVDISGSMVRQTHLLGDAEYVFEEGAADFSKLSPTRSGSKDDGTVHYQDDYISVPGGTTLSDSVYGESPYADEHLKKHHNPNTDLGYSGESLASNQYRVDIYRDATHHGPEPLQTVFDGLQHAVRLFRERAVGGDKACIIFYDSKLLWTRIVKLTDDFDYLEKFVDSSVVYLDSDPNQLDPNIGLGRMLKHGLFPAANSNTDTRAALGEALKQFEDDRNSNPNVPTSDFVVLIGDGLTTCTSCLTPQAISKYDFDHNGVINSNDAGWLEACINNGGTSPECLDIDYDINGDGVLDKQDRQHLVDSFSGNCPAIGCLSDFAHHNLAITQLKKYVEKVVAPTSVPIHVILAGENVAPHTVDLADSGDNTDCLTDSEVRQQKLDFVLGGDANGDSYPNKAAQSDAFNNMSPTAPYYPINADMYDIARMTGGLWAPIRAPAAGCLGEDKPLCDPSLKRRLDDPLCRDLGTQMIDHMDQIMGQNPYVIVETN